MRGFLTRLEDVKQTILCPNTVHSILVYSKQFPRNSRNNDKFHFRRNFRYKKLLFFSTDTKYILNDIHIPSQSIIVQVLSEEVTMEDSPQVNFDGTFQRVLLNYFKLYFHNLYRFIFPAQCSSPLQ